MTDTRPRFSLVADAPEGAPEAATHDGFQVVNAILYNLPRLVKAARAGELAARVVDSFTADPHRSGMPLWGATLAPDLFGQTLHVMRDRVGGVPVPFFDFDGAHGVATVEWPADHALAGFDGKGLPGVSLDDLAFLRDAFAAVCEARSKEAEQQIS